MRTIAVLAAARVACPPSREPETRNADSTVPDFSVMPTLPSVGPVETDSGPPVRLDSAAQGRQSVMTPTPGDQIDVHASLHASLLPSRAHVQSSSWSRSLRSCDGRDRPRRRRLAVKTGDSMKRMRDQKPLA